MRTLLMTLFAALVLAAPAAAAPVTITGPAWAQRRVDRMHVPVAPAQTVVVAPCPGWPDLAACNFPTPDSAIYLRPDVATAVALARELGGRFDTLAMTPAARWQFMVITRIRGPWWSTDSTLSGNDDLFEDAYADCALGVRRQRVTLQHPRTEWIDTAGYEPTAREQRRVCALIDRVGARAGYITPAQTGGPRRP